MTDAPRPPSNPFWRLVIVTGTLFCVTTLAVIVAGLGDRASPVARFINRHGAMLTAAEAGATVLVGYLAMARDRKLTSRAAAPPPADPDGDGAV